MPLSDEGREAIQRSNRTRRRKCGKCGSTATDVVDGDRIGGLAGLQYLYCPGCGWSRAITRRPRRYPMASAWPLTPRRAAQILAENDVPQKAKGEQR